MFVSAEMRICGRERIETWRLFGIYGTYANQYISPLFRAEVFDQELPDDHAFMKKVSEKLKKNPSIGEKIFSYFYKNEKCML